MTTINNTNQSNEPRLTSLSHGGGCGCKIAPSVLSEILKNVPQLPFPKELLIGIETSDDAAASSEVSIPIKSSLGNGSCGTFLRISERTLGAILQPQPPPCEREVRRGSFDWLVLLMVVIRVILVMDYGFHRFGTRVLAYPDTNDFSAPVIGSKTKR